MAIRGRMHDQDQLSNKRPPGTSERGARCYFLEIMLCTIVDGLRRTAVTA